MRREFFYRARARARWVARNHTRLCVWTRRRPPPPPPPLNKKPSGERESRVFGSNGNGPVIAGRRRRRHADRRTIVASAAPATWAGLVVRDTRFTKKTRCIYREISLVPVAPRSSASPETPGGARKAGAVAKSDLVITPSARLSTTWAEKNPLDIVSNCFFL